MGVQRSRSPSPVGSTASGLCFVRRGRTKRGQDNLRSTVIKATRIIALAAAVLVVVCASTASAMTLANVIDLRSTASTGSANGALFYQNLGQLTGTGSYDPFLRLQNSPVEQAFNTDYRSGGLAPLNAISDPSYTRSLTLGSLQAVNVNGKDYYAFSLLINQQGSGAARYLSLDQLKLYTAGSGSLSDLSAATLRWDMDKGMESTVYLDGLASTGSTDDMQVLIPTSAFAGVDPTTYVYLYSKFGATGGMGADSYSASFEQWSALTVSTPSVPEPSLLPLLGTGVVAALATRVRRKRED